MAKAAREEVKKSAWDIEMEKIEKDYGKGSVVNTGSKYPKVEVISTGSLKLDIATGISCIARGKVTEFMGWESSGKTTITLQSIANAQKQGLRCLLVDGEYAFDEKYARALGIDVDKLVILQLDDGGAEKCYNIAERLIRTKEVGLVAFDSQTSLLPKKAFDGEIGDSKMGLAARLMSESVPKIVNAASIGNTAVIYISQFREKIGVMFGNPETTSGGNALKFYAHMRIEFRKSVLYEKSQKEGEKGEAYGNQTTCKVIKNKMSAPFKKAKFNVNFGTGVDTIKEIFEEAVDLNIIEQGGSWFTYKGEKYQGEGTVIKLLEDNPAFAGEVKELVIKRYNDEKNSIEKRTEPVEEVPPEEKPEENKEPSPTASGLRIIG